MLVRNDVAFVSCGNLLFIIADYSHGGMITTWLQGMQLLMRIAPENFHTTLVRVVTHSQLVLFAYWYRRS